MTKRFAALLIAFSTVFAAASARAQSVCPDNFVAFADTNETLTCSCVPEATDRGSVWGMDVYTGDSSICRAARHAGVITKKGGTVSVVPEPGRSVYPGVTRNGVESINYGAFASSFHFAGAAGTSAPGASSSASGAAQTSVCPDNFVAFADTTETLTCVCAPDATDRGSVWGMDVYTGDSGVCKAARHAGVIPKNGGTVNVVPQPGRSAYAGVARNGVSSNNYGPFASSFRFAAAAGAPAAPQAAAPSAAPAPAAGAMSDCPDNFVAFADTTEPLACSCSAEAINRGSVWGMDVYTGDSGLCKAARHAGVIPKNGGMVTVIPEPGRNAYAGVTRNGVSSSNYGHFASSFHFAGSGASAATGQAASAAPASTQISMCPDNFVAFADTNETLACICLPEAMDRGSVWGMDVYTGDSGLCKAARHAGVVGAKGGPVSVIPEPGRKAYAGVTRNGVSSSNYGPFASSFRFAAAAGAPAAPAPVAPAPPPAAAPVQQPIASTLRERGEVALYIQFRTNSADLDPHTLPVLEELLATLKADENLNLGLIGHTDAVGARDFNKTLSYRRAEAVRFWLADHGISAVRIAVDGRGFDEPIADNATEQGRALNRRVQAKRM